MSSSHWLRPHSALCNKAKYRQKLSTRRAHEARGSASIVRRQPRLIDSMAAAQRLRLKKTRPRERRNDGGGDGTNFRPAIRAMSAMWLQMELQRDRVLAVLSIKVCRRPAAGHNVVALYTSRGWFHFENTA